MGDNCTIVDKYTGVAEDINLYRLDISSNLDTNCKDNSIDEVKDTVKSEEYIQENTLQIQDIDCKQSEDSRENTESIESTNSDTLAELELSTENLIKDDNLSQQRHIHDTSLPYKLWIDAKSRDWILEWQSKNGRWGVRKFSCKRWGKGKAYSHAMNFLASLTSGGIIKGSQYNRQFNDLISVTGDGNGSCRSVEDELVLQFLSQRDAASNSEKPKQRLESNPGLNALAAIAAAATASNSANNSLNIKNQASQNNSNQNQQTHVRGAVRKSGVPGVYWSQKPQGWRVVYYTGKDREFEYFKVPASASEEVISEILEVAKRFRSQVTSEGRHLPNGTVGSSSKRARAAERKAAAALSNESARRRTLVNNVSPYPNDTFNGKYKNNPIDSAPSILVDSDTLSSAGSYGAATIAGKIVNSPTSITPGIYDWLYNPMLMNLYGNYSVANQAAAIQQWALLQNILYQQNSLVQNSVHTSSETPGVPPMFPSPFLTNYPIQSQSTNNTQKTHLSQQQQQIINNQNSINQANMDLFYRYYCISPPTQHQSTSVMSSPNTNVNFPMNDAINWLSQLMNMQNYSQSGETTLLQTDIYGDKSQQTDTIIQRTTTYLSESKPDPAEENKLDIQQNKPCGTENIEVIKNIEEEEKVQPVFSNT
ncbi:uncharacterized protein CMU_007230 [Cryptosporidium muris RN66]|uniref:Uncharacterized protein n=1 Tax=Cryptosporidium muris (strain RN66) TaxID=441375 RepID=B6ADE3_CRYMR|nr:uncharacterized protein CMU_007230 [Cryptosporidium muris RN66]EEA06234.1 hypothetical protein, conserved [Cryptosporidium muris RN66]|eukprot:XP_002140583.1 hypothetical protein [Cryptosporidium muris RN66]